MLPRVHNAPPKDFEKWAHVCLNIVKHYNGGWDNGFHDQIKYWEIWNEPDGSAFWTGNAGGVLQALRDHGEGD